MIQKTKKHYLTMFLIAVTLLSPEIEARSNSSTKKKGSGSMLQGCSALSHQIEDDIHALRQNIINYGTSQATYDAIDRLRDDIKNTCKNKKCCDHSLEWKLNNVEKLADRQAKKIKKTGKLEHESNGAGGLLLTPIFAISGPAATIGAGSQAR